MTEALLHTSLCYGVMGVGVLTFLSLMFITAPYGRHYKGGWGPTVPDKWAWVLMESPSVLLFLGVYAAGDLRAGAASLALLALWQLHYLQRTFIYPLRIRTSGKRMPALIILLGMAFNSVNAWLNARWISHLGSYDASWLADPRFLVGAALFLGGFALNIQSDGVLIGLRKPGETGYKIPRGGGFRWVSAPNYLGELVEWTGWAIASWSLAGLAFALYTAANLVPRALSNHKWYQEKFSDYPPERKAILPGIL